jgi:hypothetical protein
MPRTSVPDGKEALEENYVVKIFVFVTHLQFTELFNDKR